MTAMTIVKDVSSLPKATDIANGSQSILLQNYESVTFLNTEDGTRNKEQGTRNTELGTRNSELHVVFTFISLRMKTLMKTSYQAVITCHY